jgi:selenocysteine lyase/cysteine desulfurase
VRHPLGLVSQAQSLGYRVILDAAAYLPTSRLSLRRVPADFVVFSGYKILGFPTGVGALVAKRERLEELDRPWFAGGTVDYASVQHGTHLLHRGPEGFEDGTPAFLDIAALEDGFDFIDAVDEIDVSCHLRSLTEYALRRLGELVHEDGSPMVELYGPHSSDMRGGTLAFNVRRPDGSVCPFDQVVELARISMVSLRGGCFCNPGASEAAFGFPADVTRRCLQSTASGGFSIARFAECLGPGVPVGAVRMSFGIPTHYRDVDKAVESIARNYGTGI